MRLNKVLTEKQVENAKYDRLISEAAVAYWSGYKRITDLPLSESAYQTSEADIQNQLMLVAYQLPINQLDRLEEALGDVLAKGAKKFKDAATAVAGIPGKIITSTLGFILPEWVKEKGKAFISKMIDLAKKAGEALGKWFESKKSKLAEKAKAVCGAQPSIAEAFKELSFMLVEAEGTFELNAYLAGDEFKAVVEANKADALPHQLAKAIVAAKKASDASVLGLNVRPIAKAMMGTTIVDYDGDELVDYVKDNKVRPLVKKYAKEAGIADPDELVDGMVCDMGFGEKILNEAYKNPKVKSFLDKSGSSEADAKGPFMSALTDSKGSILLALLAVSGKAFLGASTPLFPLMIAAIVVPIVTDLTYNYAKKKLGEDDARVKALGIFNDVCQGLSKLVSVLNIVDMFTGQAVSDGLGLGADEVVPDAAAAVDTVTDVVANPADVTALNTEINDWVNADGKEVFSDATVDAYFKANPNMSVAQLGALKGALADAHSTDAGFKTMTDILENPDKPELLKIPTTTPDVDATQPDADAKQPDADGAIPGVDEAKVDSAFKTLAIDEEKFPLAKQNLMTSMSDDGAGIGKGAKFTQAAFDKLVAENPAEATKLVQAMNDGGKIPQTSWDALTSGETPKVDTPLPADDIVAGTTAEILDTKLTGFGISETSLNADTFTPEAKSELLELIGAGAVNGSADTLNADELVKFVAKHPNVLSVEDITELGKKFNISDQLNIGIGGQVALTDAGAAAVDGTVNDTVNADDLTQEPAPAVELADVSNEAYMEAFKTDTTFKAMVTSMAKGSSSLNATDILNDLSTANIPIANATKILAGIENADNYVKLGSSIDEFMVHAANMDYSTGAMAEAMKFAGDGKVALMIDAAKDSGVSSSQLQTIFAMDISPDETTQFIKNLTGGDISPDKLKGFFTAIKSADAAGITNIATLSQTAPGIMTTLTTNGTTATEVVDLLKNPLLTTENVKGLVEDGTIAAMFTADVPADRMGIIITMADTEGAMANLASEGNLSTFLEQTKSISNEQLKNVMELSQQSPNLLETIMTNSELTEPTAVLKMLESPSVTVENVKDLMDKGIFDTALDLNADYGAKLNNIDIVKQLAGIESKEGVEALKSVLSQTGNFAGENLKTVDLLLSDDGITRLNALGASPSYEDVEGLGTEMKAEFDRGDAVAGMDSTDMGNSIDLETLVGEEGIEEAKTAMKSTISSIGAELGNEEMAKIDPEKLNKLLVAISNGNLADSGLSAADQATLTDEMSGLFGGIFSGEADLDTFKKANDELLKKVTENGRVPHALLTAAAVDGNAAAFAELTTAMAENSSIIDGVAAQTALDATPTVPTDTASIITQANSEVINYNKVMIGDAKTVESLTDQLKFAGVEKADAIRAQIEELKAKALTDQTALDLATEQQTAINTAIANPEFVRANELIDTAKTDITAMEAARETAGTAADTPSPEIVNKANEMLDQAKILQGKADAMLTGEPTQATKAAAAQLKAVATADVNKANDLIAKYAVSRNEGGTPTD